MLPTCDKRRKQSTICVSLDSVYSVLYSVYAVRYSVFTVLFSGFSGLLFCVLCILPVYSDYLCILCTDLQLDPLWGSNGTFKQLFSLAIYEETDNSPSTGCVASHYHRNGVKQEDFWS